MPPVFWAWASDVRQIAEVVYPAEQRKLRRDLIEIELQIDKCRKTDNCPQEKMIKLMEDEGFLRAEQQRLKDEEDKLK